MSARNQMRAMVDQLMGTGRNGETSRYQVQFNDQKVCKSFLLYCCPHDTLSSTRMDIGECPKLHDNALRADFKKAQQKFDHYYDVDATEHLKAFISNCDRRAEGARKRLLETQEELTAEVAEKANAVHELAEKIGKKLAKAEELGAQGLVDDSLKLMGEIEDLQKKKKEAQDIYKNAMPKSSYLRKQLRVCDVCSAYLGVHDSDQRLIDHFGGKLHLGFVEIREKLSELEKNYEERHEARRKFYEQERYKRDDKRSHRSKSGDQNEHHRRSRSRSRHSRHCSRSHSRSQTHKHDRRDRDRRRY
ncbi:putative RNA-binding protein Luc7-like 2 [Acyrthosiphon pisum]|uniref:Uncharacterized protein n=1 Tax=Acyrthosiphon pisum TaxID=7029 RepID=A0A8R2A1Y1_ACYPI|nr:putative RNA-binding protein Luc7-like 2 [Acyrthosiphon pisum]|eukprot:XP_001945308.1 PREDICTED: putative RNA-binding protein Luc7-like 2 [Acyrthosiphon pisum]